jgi:hypothetical protein
MLMYALGVHPDLSDGIGEAQSIGCFLRRVERVVNWEKMAASFAKSKKGKGAKSRFTS